MTISKKWDQLMAMTLSRYCTASVLSLVPVSSLDAASIPSRFQNQIPICGDAYASPFAPMSDAGRRPCPVPTARNYTPIHRGIGFDILALESEACFVPDESLRLLDDVVAAVIKRVPKPDRPLDAKATIDHVLSISRATGDVLAEKGFGLSIPTETLGDALHFRNAVSEPSRHIFDCDTGSMILMTVADFYSLSASLVEITLSSGSGHNFVRWTVTDGTTVDWDVNGRGPCITPSNLPKFQGIAQTREQTTAYVLAIRASIWQSRNMFQHAVDDYRQSIKLSPGHPIAANNFAWMIATKEYPERVTFKEEALAAANKAVSIHRTSNHLDTLACVYAYVGDFARAGEIESEALAAAPSNAMYAARVQQFRSATPKDCNGAE
jgi:hypothetical protein